MKIYVDGSKTRVAWVRNAGTPQELSMVTSISWYAPERKRTTNNEAEFFAVIVALEDAIKDGIKEAEILSDSELVVNQMTCKYATRAPHLRVLRDKVAKLMSRVAVEFKWIPREENEAGFLLE